MPIVSCLRTKPLPLLVPDGVFDAFGWTESDVLEWRRPRVEFDATTAIDGSDPARMVFVFKSRCDWLPNELARLHAFGLGLTDETALAPYAIDDATDELFARRQTPSELLWLAADNLNALFWGLHDWAHFHSHGPFEARAWTELQCDASALSWLAHNRETIGLSRDDLERAKHEILSLIASRFVDEGALVPRDILSRIGADVVTP
jgi:hypothetical protein